ncbi:cell division protein FtsZ [Campylobacter mucosalis]|uniref:cell division protein FtsZ n=1 Tax=Campylobacter mucosalis TaxID=202 RepID=UPI0004D69A00|nr:cell division protein FtsZ [Campylobacter mucosalis]KEA46356.1 cell division protein FtsZ [Campylobacter mucosalis]QKF63166.1 cell division protein FtsZ [Campylobacter mucosalis]
MGNFKIEEGRSSYGTKIKVIGVGGGGGNMIGTMIKEYPDLDIDLIVANTDRQALDRSNAFTKIQIGEKITRGLGAGMKPEVGKASAEESYDELKSAFENTDIVFVAAGLGGGTGTGAAPVVAQAAKECGALAVSVVTMPFAYEGKKRRLLADRGLEELRKESDSVIVILNEKLVSLVDKRMSIPDSLKIADGVLTRAVGGMSSVILGNGDINIDFADVRTIMSHRGMAIMSVGDAVGENAAQEAMKEAIQSPLLDDVSIDGALGVLVHFRHHPSASLNDINDALKIVNDSADDMADIIFGTTSDDTLDEGKVEVTIVATGFEIPANNSVDANEIAKKESEKAVEKREYVMRIRKASGGEGFDSESYLDQLDTPPCRRHQID